MVESSSTGIFQTRCPHYDALIEQCRGIKLIEEVAVKAESPASIANLGAGFDVIGVALELPRDSLTLELRKGRGEIELNVEGEEAPIGRKNLVYPMAEEILRSCGLLSNLDVRILLKKGVPVSMGLGSSASSSVALLESLKSALGISIPQRESILVSACGELYAAGALHYDNVSSSYLGGFVLTDYSRLSFIKLPSPANVFFTVVMPASMKGKEGKTKEARSLIPKRIELEDSVKQSSALGKLIASLFLKDIEMFGEAVSTDFIAEPYRKKMIPFYEEMKREALNNGALGFNISGAGPSVFAVTDSRKNGEKIGKLLAGFLEERGIPARFFTSPPSTTGASSEKLTRNP